jgi:hypothetical protein
MKSQYPVPELLGLPGLPDSLKGIYAWIKAGKLKTSPRKKADGTDSKHKDVLADSLPAETQRYLQSQHLDTVAASMVPAVKPAKTLPVPLPPAQLPALTELTRHQMGILEARMFFNHLSKRRQRGYGAGRWHHV